MKKLLTIAILAGLFLIPGCGSDKATQAPIPSDEAPPLMPVGLDYQIAGNGEATLVWSANTEPDLGGYRVYLYDPSPDRDRSYVVQNAAALLVSEQWKYLLQTGQTIWVMVTAVDEAGQESSPAGPVQIYRQAGATDPSGGTGGSTRPPETRDPHGDSGSDPGLNGTN